MYKKIIVCLSLSHGFGVKAIQVARSLLSDNGRIIAVHVMEPPNETVKLYLPEDYLETALATTKAEMAKRTGGDAEIESVILTDHSAGRAVTRYAEEVGADCIVVGSYRAEKNDTFLGSTTQRIVRHASCPVHVLR